MMGPGEALAIWAVATLVIATISARRLGAWIGVILAAMLLPLPALTDGQALTRALLTAPPILALVRSLDLALDRQDWPFRRRLLHLVSVVDSRRFARRRPGLARSALSELLISAAIYTAAGYGIARVPGDGPAIWIRGLLGGLMLFGALGVSSALLELALAASGISAPRMQEAPHRATSLNEFWARRWNRVISAVLHERCFAPLRRSSPMVALIAVFAASAALHAYQAGVSIGAQAALPMASFFLLQPPLLFLERKLGVRKWTPVAGWSWTLLALLLTAPLLTETALPILLWRP